MDTRRLRLLLFYNWIVACALLAGVNGGKPACHELAERVVLTDDAETCIPDARAAVLGNAYAPVILDFSTAKKEAFELLTKGLVEIAGAFVMDGNDQVETLNFGEIKRFEGKRLPSGSNFISIRNNPNLKKLEWNASVTAFTINDDNQPLHIFIYNNPQLDVASFKMIFDAARRKSNIVRSFQDSAGECRFQNEHNDAEYFPPTADILKNCKKIKGDFKMTGGSLAGLSIQLTRDSCLQLINVDMTGAKLTLNAGKLSTTCKDKSTSKISINKKLCGFDLEHLESSFNKPGDVTIELDNPSCTIACTTPEQKSHKYYICKKEEETTSTTAGSTAADSSNNNNINDNNNNNNSENNNNQKTDKISIWVIIIGSGGAFVLVVLILIAISLIIIRKRRKLWWKKYKNISNDTVSDTFGEKMRKSGFQFIMDASLLDINTMRNKFSAVDKIVVDEKTREKPPTPWKSSEGAALGSLVTIDGHEYLIGSRPKDKETAIAFWEYAHDHLVRHFILIGEAGKDFMPTKSGQTIDLGTVRVTLEKKESPVKLFTSHIVRIKRTVNDKRCEWKVHVDHLASWTGDIPPSMEHCYDLFGLLERMNGQKTSEETSSGKAKDKEPGKPKDKEGRHMIVCPDGKERTGALLLLDMVWNELLKVEEEDESSINIEGLLARLRTQIPSAVSDFHLYLFLHLLIVKKFYQLSQPPDAPFPQKFVEEAFAELGLKDGRGNYSREKLTRTGSAENTGGTKSKETMESSP